MKIPTATAHPVGNVRRCHVDLVIEYVMFATKIPMKAVGPIRLVETATNAAMMDR